MSWSPPATIATAILLAALLLSGLPGLAQNGVEGSMRRAEEATRAGDHNAAVAAFEQALTLDPGLVAAWFQLGRSRAALEDVEGALEAYRRTVALDPTHTRALNNLANIHFRQGRYEEAEVWYRGALEADPDYLLALYHHGWVLRQLNRRDEAESALRHCLELTPRDQRERVRQDDCAFVLGTLRFRAGAWSETTALMERVLAEHPGHLEARYYLGMSYRRLGRDEEAGRQLEMHRRMLQANRTSEPVRRQPD